MMEADITVKAIGILVGLVAIPKVFSEVVHARSSRQREEYKFVKDYLRDLEIAKEHRFALEKGFLAITGDQYSVEEIHYLLGYESPSLAVSLRAESVKFVEFETGQGYRWKGRYKTEWWRKTAPARFLAGYALSAFCAMFPFFAAGSKALSNAAIVTCCASFAMVAVGFLFSSDKARSALRLMELARPVIDWDRVLTQHARRPLAELPRAPGGSSATSIIGPDILGG